MITTRLSTHQFGIASLALCSLLLGSSLLLTLLLQRWVIDRQRMAHQTWPALQAQTLGHGAVMWTLAQFADDRPLNDRCEAIGPSVGQRLDPVENARPIPDSFEFRMAQPGRRLRCHIDLNTQGTGRPWTCDCSNVAVPQNGATSGRSSSDPSPGGPTGSWELVMASEADGLRALVQTSVDDGLGRQARWSESVRLRRDAQMVWRPVVGTWMDGR